MTRKNFLFSNTSNDAESSVILFYILQTAIANGMDAKLYLKTLINKICSNPLDEELENPYLGKFLFNINLSLILFEHIPKLIFFTFTY